MIIIGASACSSWRRLGSLLFLLLWNTSHLPQPPSPPPLSSITNNDNNTPSCWRTQEKKICLNQCHDTSTTEASIKEADSPHQKYMKTKHTHGHAIPPSLPLYLSIPATHCIHIQYTTPSFFSTLPFFPSFLLLAENVPSHLPDGRVLCSGGREGREEEKKK